MIISKPAFNQEEASKAIKSLRPKGLVKVAAIDPKGSAPVCQTFNMPGEVDALIAWAREQNVKLKRNVYYEVGVPKRRGVKKSTEADTAFAMYRAVDCDPKPGESAADAKPRIYAALKSGVVPAPTFTYESGNGVVALWRREKSMKLDSPEVIAKAKGDSKAIAQALGGKALGFDSCHSQEHLFRLPYSINYPDAKKIAAGRKVEQAGNFKGDAARKYSDDDFPSADIVTTAATMGDADKVELNELNLSERTREIVETGTYSEGKMHGDADESPSGWRWDGICSLLREGVSAEQVVAILTDEDYAISEGVMKRSNPIEFARKEVAKAIGEGVEVVNRQIRAEDDFPDDMSEDPEVEESDDAPKYSIDLEPYQIKGAENTTKRDWIYKPAYIRKFVGLTVATGGAGKSSLILVECIAMAAGIDLLALGDVKPKIPKRKVFYWNGEDPMDELERRVEAVCKHFGITQKDIDGNFFLKSGRDLPIKIAHLKGANQTRIAVPVVKAMRKAIRDNGIDVVGIDPFVSSHDVPENDNVAIDIVAKKWSDICDKENCAVQLSHHTRKNNGNGTSIEDSRGASALNNAARTRRAIQTMTAAEAQKAGIVGNARYGYFRADMGGSSMMKPTESLDWFRFVSVDMDNGESDDDADSVGVVVPWEYKLREINITPEKLERAEEALREGGPYRVDPQSPAWAGFPIALALGLDVTDKEQKDDVKDLVKKLEDKGTIYRKTADDEKGRPRIFYRVFAYEPDKPIDFG